MSNGGPRSVTVTPPANIRLSFVMWLAVSVLLLLLIIALWNAPEPPRLPSDRPQMPPEWASHPAQRSADTARAIGRTAFHVFELCIPVGVAIVARRMRAGSRRARTVLTVIGIALGVLAFVTTMANVLALTAPVGAYFWIRLLINIALFVLLAFAIPPMFGPRASEFFARSQ